MFEQKIYILSMCVKVSKTKSDFHFKGAYLGKKVSKIIVCGGNFQKYEEYLLKVKVVDMFGETLVVEYLKSKRLSR